MRLINAKCNQEIKVATLLSCVAYVEDQNDCNIVLYLNFAQFL